MVKSKSVFFALFLMLLCFSASSFAADINTNNTQSAVPSMQSLEKFAQEHSDPQLLSQAGMIMYASNIVSGWQAGYITVPENINMLIVPGPGNLQNGSLLSGTKGPGQLIGTKNNLALYKLQKGDYSVNYPYLSKSFNGKQWSTTQVNFQAGINTAPFANVYLTAADVAPWVSMVGGSNSQNSIYQAPPAFSQNSQIYWQPSFAATPPMLFAVPYTNNSSTAINIGYFKDRIGIIIPYEGDDPGIAVAFCGKGVMLNSFLNGTTTAQPPFPDGTKAYYVEIAPMAAGGSGKVILTDKNGGVVFVLQYNDNNVNVAAQKEDMKYFLNGRLNVKSIYGGKPTSTLADAAALGAETGGASGALKAMGYMLASLNASYSLNNQGNFALYMTPNTFTNKNANSVLSQVVVPENSIMHVLGRDLTNKKFTLTQNNTAVNALQSNAITGSYIYHLIGGAGSNSFELASAGSTLDFSTAPMGGVLLTPQDVTGAGVVPITLDSKNFVKSIPLTDIEKSNLSVVVPYKGILTSAGISVGKVTGPATISVMMPYAGQDPEIACELFSTSTTASQYQLQGWQGLLEVIKQPVEVDEYAYVYTIKTNAGAQPIPAKIVFYSKKNNNILFTLALNEPQATLQQQQAMLPYMVAGVLNINNLLNNRQAGMGGMAANLAAAAHNIGDSAQQTMTKEIAIESLQSTMFLIPPPDALNSAPMNFYAPSNGYMVFSFPKGTMWTSNITYTQNGKSMQLPPSKTWGGDTQGYYKAVSYQFLSAEQYAVVMQRHSNSGTVTFSGNITAAPYGGTYVAESDLSNMIASAIPAYNNTNIDSNVFLDSSRLNIVLPYAFNSTSGLNVPAENTTYTVFLPYIKTADGKDPGLSVKFTAQSGLSETNALNGNIVNLPAIKDGTATYCFQIKATTAAKGKALIVDSNNNVVFNLTVGLPVATLAETGSMEPFTVGGRVNLNNVQQGNESNGNVAKYVPYYIKVIPATSKGEGITVTSINIPNYSNIAVVSSNQNAFNMKGYQSAFPNLTSYGSTPLNLGYSWLFSVKPETSATITMNDPQLSAGSYNLTVSAQ